MHGVFDPRTLGRIYYSDQETENEARNLRPGGGVHLLPVLEPMRSDTERAGVLSGLCEATAVLA